MEDTLLRLQTSAAIIDDDVSRVLRPSISGRPSKFEEDETQGLISHLKFEAITVTDSDLCITISQIAGLSRASRFPLMELARSRYNARL